MIDFGFPKVLDQRTHTICGTPEYFAPEILLKTGYGKPVDWWTLGILIYELLTGITPFADSDPIAIYKKILNGKVKFPRTFDKDAKSLIKHLLTTDLAKRYGNLRRGVHDIKQHRWFSGFDWLGLLQKRTVMPYLPTPKSPYDTIDSGKYRDSISMPPAINPTDDPFLDW